MIDRLFVRLVRSAQRQRFHAAHPLAAAAWVAAIRMLGERFTGTAAPPGARHPFLWWLHFFAFYLALVMAISALLARITPADWKKTTNVVGLGLLLGVVPPLIDVAIYGAGGFGYEYQLQLARLPWSLYAPPRILPAGEAIVLWLAVVLIAAFGLWQGASWPRKLLLGPAAYALTLFFQAVLPSLTARVVERDPQVFFNEWKIPALAACAMLGLVFSLRAWRRVLERAPQILLAPLFCALGGSLRGRLDGPVWLAAFLMALLSLGFALANDYHDRAEDALQGRPLLVDADAAALLSLLPLVGVAAALAARVELGLCCVAFAAVAHAYHADPLRTKCVFPLSYKTEGLLAGLALLAGMVADPHALPAGPELLVALAVGLGAPAALVFKDYKDVEADRAAGVRTAFVIAEERGWARPIVLRWAAGLLLLSLALAAAFVSARGAGPVWIGGLAALALAAPALLLRVRSPSRAVAVAIVGCELFLALAAAAVLSA